MKVTGSFGFTFCNKDVAFEMPEEFFDTADFDDPLSLDWELEEAFDWWEHEVFAAKNEETVTRALARLGSEPHFLPSPNLKLLRLTECCFWCTNDTNCNGGEGVCALQPERLSFASQVEQWHGIQQFSSSMTIGVSLTGVSPEEWSSRTSIEKWTAVGHPDLIGEDDFSDDHFDLWTSGKIEFELDIPTDNNDSSTGAVMNILNEMAESLSFPPGLIFEIRALILDSV